MKYLFVASRYGNDIETNGLVLSSIIDEIVKDGNEVVCLSESDKIREYEYNGAKVYTIRQGINTSLKKKSRKVGRILELLLELFFYFSYPSDNKILENKMYQKICELNNHFKFDYIYAVYRKYTNVGAILKFKSGHKETKCAVLFFDLIEANKPKGYCAWHFNMICRKKYQKISHIVDKTFLPNDSKCEYLDVIQPEKRGILYYPGFIKRKIIISTKSVQKEKTINMIFAGTLDLKYRNPTPLFETLKELKELGYSISLKLYVKGNCDNIIELAKNDYKLNIVQEKMIDKERLLMEYQYADVLVNISNHGIKATPSKVFELLSTGKPIINIVHDKNDPTKRVFDNYMMAYSIMAYENISNQVKRLALFLKEAHDLSEEEYAIVERRFENNTPYKVYQSIKNF